MKCLVGTERTTHLGKSFVVVDGTVPDKLNLWNAGNCLKIRVKDRLLGVARLVVSVTVAVRFGIKSLCSSRV